jgi:hypothetical protein
MDQVKLNDLFIFKGDFYTKKTLTDYIFSPLNNDKKQ